MKIGKFLLILILVSGWIFSGWPVIWQNPRTPPEVQEVFAQEINTFRATTYEITDFSGTIYDLTLNQDLANDYFAMVIGGSSGASTRNPGDNFVRMTRDPNGTGSLTASGATDQVRLERTSTNGSWNGSVTIIESLGDSSVSGFKLLDVVDVTITGTGIQASTGNSSAWTDINQVVTFGGIRGGGTTVVNTAASDDHCYGHGRVWPSGTITVNVERDTTGCGADGESSTYTVYVVEWGSQWGVQNVTVTGNAGANGVDVTGEYDTAAITSVVRDNTWVWAAGYTADGGIGDSWAGQIATLGDGVTQLANETVVAVGAEYADTRSVEVFVLEHIGAAVDYRFKADGDAGSNPAQNYDHTVDAKASGETYTTVSSLMGVATQVAMDGGDGSWAVFYGSGNPISNLINLAVDEDGFANAERAHTTEEVDYWVFDKTTSGVIKNSAGTVVGEYGVVSSVGSTASTINFTNTLINPIVVTTYQQTSSANEPSVVRMENVGATSFDTYLQLATSTGSSAVGDVYWIAVESGAHTLPGNVSMEAGSVSVSGVNENGDWGSGQMNQITPINSYTTPLVLGQIQTTNDTSWQVFWSNNGTSSIPPRSSSIYVGRHVGEDPDVVRTAEDIGYIIIEDSTGTTDGVTWTAARTTDTVEGVENSPPYTFGTGFSVSPPSTEGRFGLQYNSSNGTGTAFPRSYWGVRHTGSTILKAFRQYSGQSWVSWIQSVDLTGITYTAPNSLPVASAVSIDSAAASVTLIENTTTSVVCAGTVTDTNGYTDIAAVGAYLFRTGAGTSTLDNYNYKYTLYGDSDCVPSEGSGNSETYTCTFSFQYYAHATDAGPYSGDDWTCEMWPEDNVATGTPATDVIEVDSTVALNVTSSIGYDPLNPNIDTGTTDQITTVINTGNRSLDVQVGGDIMCTDYPTCSGDSFSYNQQKFDLTASVVYSSKTYTLTATATPTTIALVLPIPESTTTPVSDDIFWGITIPSGQSSGSYTGQNILTATTNN